MLHHHTCVHWQHEHRNGAVIWVAALVVTGVIEACLQCLKWRPEQSSWQPIHFTETVSTMTFLTHTQTLSQNEVINSVDTEQQALPFILYVKDISVYSLPIPRTGFYLFYSVNEQNLHHCLQWLWMCIVLLWVIVQWTQIWWLSLPNYTHYCLLICCW